MIRLLRQEFTSVCSFIEEKRRCFYASIYYSNGWYSKVTFKYNFISEFIDFYRIINPFAKIWYNSRKKDSRKNTMTFLQNYLSQFNLDSILTTVFNKLLSLILLYIVFLITKKLVLLSVKKLLAPSLKLARQDQGRQKTITRLVENILNYALYFILIYWVLSILGLPVSSLLAGAGIAGVAIGLGAQGFLSDLVNGFLSLSITSLMWGMWFAWTIDPLPLREPLSASGFGPHRCGMRMGPCISSPTATS